MVVRSMVSLVFAALLFASNAARADDASQSYDPDEALTQSLGYSLGVVGVGGVLLLIEPVFGASVLGLGLTITPSLGHFYADNWVHGMLTLGGRLVTSTAAVVCLVGAALPQQIDSDADPDAWTSQRKALLSIGLVAAAATLGLAVFDIATAPGAARDANTRGQQARWRPRVAGWFTPGGGGLTAVTAF